MVFVKGALSFQRGQRETSCVRIPHDLPALQAAILSSALGLGNPGLVFVEADGDVGIAEREEQLLSHCALLAAVASENELLDCLLSFDWAKADLQLVPALAAHLAVMARSTQLPYPHLEDAASNYLRHLKFRPAKKQFHPLAISFVTWSETGFQVVDCLGHLAFGDVARARVPA